MECLLFYRRGEWKLSGNQALVLLYRIEVTAGHHCGGETFQSIFSRIGWKYSEKSLIHSDDRPLLTLLDSNLIYKPVQIEYIAFGLPEFFIYFYFFVFRLETIMDCDRVLVMNAGQVAEFAPPSDLLSDHESMFYSLVHNNSSTN